MSIKPNPFGNAQLLAAFSKQPCFNIGLDRCLVNERRNCIESKEMEFQMKPRPCKRILNNLTTRFRDCDGSGGSSSQFLIGI